jgi:hypothetical protein
VDHVQQVPFLSQQNHYQTVQYDHADTVCAAADTSELEDSKRVVDDNKAEACPSTQVFVWIYVQRYDCPADKDFPIAQSYLDIILRGCMGISKDFARSFIETTKGWTPEQQVLGGNLNKQDPALDSDQDDAPKVGWEGQDHVPIVEATWIDDREEPIYVRADPAYSEKKADVIDRLLEDHIPEHLENREPAAVNKDDKCQQRSRKGMELGSLELGMECGGKKGRGAIMEQLRRNPPYKLLRMRTHHSQRKD